MLVIPEKLHLFIKRKSEEFLALSKNLVHEVLAYSMIDKVEKSRIGASLFYHNEEVEVENWKEEINRVLSPLYRTEQRNRVRCYLFQQINGLVDVRVREINTIENSLRFRSFFFMFWILFFHSGLTGPDLNSGSVSLSFNGLCKVDSRTRFESPVEVELTV